MRPLGSNWCSTAEKISSFKYHTVSIKGFDESSACHIVGAERKTVCFLKYRCLFDVLPIQIQVKSVFVNEKGLKFH